MFTAQRGRSFRSCLVSTHHNYTTLHINCGLASVFTSSDPFRNCPPLSPPHCREHQSLTNMNNSPTHFELQTALRPLWWGWGVEQVWITQQEPYRTPWTLWHRLTFLPFRWTFNFLLPPPVHRSLLVQEAVHLLLLDTHLSGRGNYTRTMDKKTIIIATFKSQVALYDQLLFSPRAFCVLLLRFSIVLGPTTSLCKIIKESILWNQNKPHEAYVRKQLF